ncbi:DNA-3-methyladenine glycosylase I [Propionibacterium cyclohexanicum]|uniref:DNA-3-methyladenine glycosylase I n=1 Tax=Propionibacterium cyclohexanicum TaxID=64702 RepID=A0A1H9TRE5_9ACTN|nr:DNA-3-methyladenine glycosylase I [Propionibacterium cyclohexanicum]SER99243.1 DNA-3-methyladenine glycosylase I [Propionibacterium cyclohexanicum]
MSSPSDASSAAKQIAEGLVLCEDGRVRPPWAACDPLLREYFDTEWGRPVRTEQGLYERLCLEAFQSGLSWSTILRKRPAFRSAFAGFDPDAVAGFGSRDVDRLMADQGIVRNRRKIGAAITNAKATVDLRDRGGLAAFIWSRRPDPLPRRPPGADAPTATAESAALATDLRAQGFVFVGPTTMYALMQAIGLVDPRTEGCSELID